MARRALQVAVAALVVATTALVLPSEPAAAAGCSSADGVSVVVDFHELGGGVRTGCVADGGGKSAAALLGAAGFPLTFVQRQPGFVCRVSGQPASDPCVNTPPADAYWGLYWSDGSTGSWTYSTLGVGSLTVPDGGSVALSWTGSSGRSQPGVAPAVHERSTPTARPTRKPTDKRTDKPASKPTAEPTASSSATSKPTSAATPSATTTPTEAADGGPGTTPSPKPTERTTKPKPKPTTKPTPTTDASEPVSEPASATPEPASAEPDGSDEGLPAWVGPVVVAVLFAAGAAVAVVRRRRDPS